MIFVYVNVPSRGCEGQNEPTFLGSVSYNVKFRGNLKQIKYELHALSAEELDFFRCVPVDEDERLFRIKSPNTRTANITPLAKVNFTKHTIRYPEHRDDEQIRWMRPRKCHWIEIESNYFNSIPK